MTAALMMRTGAAVLVGLGAACMPLTPAVVPPAGPQAAAPDPTLAIATPDSFVVRFETTRGDFTAIFRSRWAPVGVDRVYELVRRGYYTDIAVHRVVPNFVAQFGIHGYPEVNTAWRMRRIADDSVRVPNARGTLAFARGGPGTRTVQLFVNLRDNTPRLDTLNVIGFPPVGEVLSGMSVVDSLYAGYDNVPQDSVQRQGNAWVRRARPDMAFIRRVVILEEWRRPVVPADAQVPLAVDRRD
jgi:peptidyl-prolyl cis-trans isomerase A (cyclophilin A)